MKKLLLRYIIKIYSLDGVNEMKRKISLNQIKIIIIVCINLTSFLLYNNYFIIKTYAENQIASEITENNSLSENSSKVKQDKSENIKNYFSYEGDPLADDISLLSQYLYEQSIGEMPKGADGRKVAYLTFDDGPSETITSKILDILKEENIKATFFVIGKSVEESEKNQQIVKRMAREGHSIGNHTYSHNYTYLYPNNSVNVYNFINDLEKTNSILKGVLGDEFSTRVIRCPGGHMSWKNMRYLDKVLKSNEYYQVDWNSLSKDAEGKKKNADELLDNVIKTIGDKEKAIILMHDTYSKEETVKALPMVIKYLKDRGYEFRIIR